MDQYDIHVCEAIFVFLVMLECYLLPGANVSTNWQTMYDIPDGILKFAQPMNV